MTHKIDHIFPSRVDFVKIYDNSPFMVVFTHGMNPYGNAFCGELFQPLIRLCDKHKLSHFLYYRKYWLYKAVITDIADIKDEYKDMMTYVHHLCPANNKHILLIGHSLGGAYVHMFNTLNGGKNVIRSISLDGTDFYLAVPYFVKIGYHLTDIDENDIKYRPDKVLYKNKPVSWSTLTFSEDIYKMLYKFKDKICDTHYIVDYYGNPRAPKTVTFHKIQDDHYPNLYNLKYSKEYYHSMHKYSPAAQVIFDKLIKPLMSG